jgi:hypothetical protein
MDFLRNTPPALLLQYFSAVGITLPRHFHWEAAASTRAARLVKVIEDLGYEDRSRVLNDADRLRDMADEAGQAALYSVAPVPEELDRLSSGYARALSMLLKAPHAFEHAEQVRYNDDHRFGRMWAGYESQSGCIVPRDGAPVERFKTAIKERFRSRNVETETCERRPGGLA